MKLSYLRAGAAQSPKDYFRKVFGSAVLQGLRVTMVVIFSLTQQNDACVCCITRKICGRTHRSRLLSHHRGHVWPTHTQTVPFSVRRLSSTPFPPFLCKQSSFPTSLFPSISLRSEVGHSGSPVYSNAAASGERASEGARGKTQESGRETAYFNICANPHQHGATRTSVFTGHPGHCQEYICIHDRTISRGPQIFNFITLYCCLINNPTDFQQPEREQARLPAG